MATPTPLADIRQRLQNARVFVVPYCHPDWAWTHTRRWHELRYARALAEALDIIAAQEAAGLPADAPEALRWYMDCLRTELVPFLDLHPDRLPELRRRVAEGRIGICGGFSNVRINHVEGETFVRAMTHGRRAWHRLFPDADLAVHADIVDVAVGHPQLPQLLRLAGYRYLQFWRPHEALNAKQVPYHFRWRGLDGSEILASRGCYGGVADIRFAPPDLAEHWPDVVQTWWTHELRDKLERSPAGLLWVQHGADDNRPLRTYFFQDTPLDLPRLIGEWNRRETSRMAFATPREVFRELEAARDRLPAWSGTLDPCDVAYNAAWGGAHGLWRLRSQCARALSRAEAWNALALASGLITPAAAAGRQADLDQTWDDVLLLSAHAVQWLFQDDFDEVEDLGRQALATARRAEADRLCEFARATAAPPDTLALVANPLPQARVATVPLRVTFDAGDRRGVPQPLRLEDTLGREVPYQVLDRLRHAGVTWELDTLVQMQLPPMGWSGVVWREAAPTADPAPTVRPEATTFDNGLLRLAFERGRLLSVTELDSGRPWTAPPALPFGQLRVYAVDTDGPLHVGAITGTADAIWETWAVREAGPVRWAYRSTGTAGPHPVTLEVRLYRQERRVEFVATVDWTAFDGFLAAHVAYPAPGRLTGDMPFGVEDKDLADEPRVGIERTRDGMFIAQSWVDWTDGQRGLAYVAHDGDRYFRYLADAPALAHTLVNSFRRPADTWERHINRRIEGAGPHSFTFSLIPHDGDWRQAALWTAADALRTPPAVTWPLAGSRALPATAPRLELSPDHVRLSALHVTGPHLTLRVFETAGHDTETTLRLPVAPLAVETVDLVGEALADGPPLSCDGSELRIRLRAWQIATLAIRLP